MVIDILVWTLNGLLLYTCYQVIQWLWSNWKMNELNKSLDEFNEHIIICRVEEQDGMFYFWNVLDDTFVGQARTVPEIAAISERLQKQLLMEEGDKDLLDKLQKMVREVYEVRSESTVR